MFVGLSDRTLRRCIVVFGCLAALSFGAAIVVFPDGTYNPAMRMLSTLGRSVLAGEEWPLCHLAAVGGCAALFALNGKASGRRWTYLLLSVFSFFLLVIALHALKVIPFAPAVPSLQKLVILSFTAWIIRIQRKVNV